MNNLTFLPCITWIASLLATSFTLECLTHAKVMDNPIERSNHKAPVPRGGGIAMIGVTLICFAFLGIAWQILAAGILLAVVSFVDDMRGLSARVRFLAQFIAVALALTALHGRLLPDVIPVGIEYACIAFAWLWFVNLTNFMDGIDGISAMQTIMMMVGIILIHSLYGGLPLWLAVSAGVLAASAFGFLRFNISPAKLFMGDVGSIPLGFLNFYLLLCLALYGHPAAALILPAYYVTDATYTLLRRAYAREKLWLPHSQHAYQKAVRGGMSHNAVVLRITLLNSLLVALALYPSHTMIAAIATCAVAYVAALILVCHLSKCAS